jgi:hypothetical protein
MEETSKLNENSQQQTEKFVFKAGPTLKPKSKLLIIIVLLVIALTIVIAISFVTIYLTKSGSLPSIKQVFNNTGANKPEVTQNKTANEKISTPTNDTTAFLKLKYVPIGSCPLATNCKKAIQIGNSIKGISIDFLGLGFNLSDSNSVIYAVIDGTVVTQNTVKNGEKISIVSIVNKQRDTKINYEFPQDQYKPLIVSGNIQEAQKIGNLKNNTNIKYGSNTFSFTISMQRTTASEYLELKSSANGLGIESPDQ